MLLELEPLTCGILNNAKRGSIMWNPVNRIIGF